MSMSRVALALPLVCLLLAPAFARDASAGSSRPQWVFFRDHGTPAEEDAARRDAEQTLLHPRRIERLRRVEPNGPVVRENDLAVSPSYVGALTSLGATVRQRSRWLNAVSIEAAPPVVEAIRRLPFVSEVRPVLGWRADRPEPGAPLPPPAKVADARSEFYGPSLTQLSLIRADALQDSGYTGDGVLVAMLDSGFKKSHPAFQSTRLIAERDFVKNDGNTENEANDDIFQHNHGTGTWAVVGGWAPTQLIGIAPFAEFLLAKTEDLPREVPIEEDNWVAAAEWADGLGADVISSSLAYRDFDGTQSDYDYGDMDGKTTVVALGAREAIRRGIVVVTAMGNEAQNHPINESIWSPADADSAVSVGAVNALGALAAFSSNGPTADGRIKPEVCALGVQTVWAVASTNGYGPANGTSLSTPCIGGAVALLLEAHPTWTPGQVLSALRRSGDRFDAPDNARGYGIPDLALASYFGGSRTPAQRPWPFALVSPADETIDDCTPTFTWTRSRSGAGGSVTYRLEIDDDPAFSEPFVVSGITDTVHTPAQALPVSGRLYWRVTAVAPNTKERAAYLDETFTLQAATLVTLTEAPAPGATLTAVPEFRWRRPSGSSPDSTRFAVVYGTNSTLSGALRVDAGHDTAYTPPLPLPLESTTYYWKVEATDPTECAFGVSAIRSFTSAAYPPAAVTLVAPAEADTFEALPIEFRWRSSSDPNPADEVTYRLELTPEIGSTLHFDATDTTMTVTSLGSVGRLSWRVFAVDAFDHATASTQTRTVYYHPSTTPDAALGSPRPNPFGPATEIPIVVPGSSSSQVSITVGIYDIDGRLVRKLVDGLVTPGSQRVSWDGKDEQGRAAANGVYYVRFETPSRTFEEKLVRVR